MPNKPCPFCELDVSTKIYYYNKWKNIIVYRSPQDSDSKYCLLAVRVGVGNHKGLPTAEEREDLLVPLIAVAEAQVRSGMAEGYDIEEVVKSDHYYYYANLT